MNPFKRHHFRSGDFWAADQLLSQIRAVYGGTERRQSEPFTSIITTIFICSVVSLKGRYGTSEGPASDGARLQSEDEEAAKEARIYHQL